MKNLRYGLVSIVCFIGIIGSMRAHNPGDIGYIFQEQEQRLTIHTTQKGVIDLLKTLRTDLSDKSGIDPKEYWRDLTDYFNRNLEICINDRVLALAYIDGNFSGHDVTIHFNLGKSDAHWSTVEIAVTAFTDIYKRPKNTVKIIGVSETRVYFLNKNNRSCFFESKAAA